MTRQRYPLEALIRVRQQVKEGRQRQLAARLAMQRHAADRAREEERLHELACSKLAAARREAPGTSSAGALAGRHHYLQRLEKRADEADDRRARAQRELAAAEAAVASARSELADAVGELEIIERDRERFDERRRRSELQRAELELEDLLAARQATSDR